MNRYRDTDQRIHLLCQLLTKANRTFVPKKEDDSHTNLYFDTLGDRITGRWIEVKDDKLLFVLQLANLTIEVLNQKQDVLASFSTIGNTMEEVEVEMEKELANLGLDKKGFRDPLHYEIPKYSFEKQAISAIDLDAIGEWKQFRELANEACSLLMGHTQMQEEIRIWPHHFDTGIYAVLNSKIGLGFGLAMQDEMVGAPYFYMSAYALNGTINYTNLPKGKLWGWEIGEHWKGAILSLNTLNGKPEIQRRAIIKDYLSEAFDWFIKQ